MATLKGQNLRIIAGTSCVAMATNCTITLTGNTDDASTKDDVGMASKPTVTSKSWSVQVDSLSVADAAAMLTAIKSLTPFTLYWDETSTDDNQSAEGADFSRTGSAFLNDVTFNFNDRENSQKSLQFTGTGAIADVTTTPTVTPVTATTYTKGQFVRLFLAETTRDTATHVIAAAKTLSLHVSLSLEDATTKDTAGDWVVQEATGLSYDISTNALVRSGDTITSSVTGLSLNELETIYEASQPVEWKIANVSGANNRTMGAVIASGSVIVSQLAISASNRNSCSYDATLTGYGAYTVSA